MRQTTLPNGLAVASVSDLEARVLYEEIFRERPYLQHGIRVADGDCVFDVGANIGLFTLALARGYRDLTIFAFEPIPNLCALLRENVRRHAGGAAVRVYECGLADTRGTARFEYDRFATMASTAQPTAVAGSVRRDADLDSWIAASVVDLRRIGTLSERAARALVTAAATPVLRTVMRGIWAALFRWQAACRRLFLRHFVRPMTTVSEVLRDNPGTVVDLLKIDVEGGELAVLEGIAEGDWPRIRQLVVEVHEVDGRIDAMRALLEERGYHTTVDREDWAIHRLLGIATLYAIRP